MDIYILSLAESYSIGIAATIGLVRFKVIDKSYHPFIWICCLAFVNEIISTITAQVFRNNAINLNIYVLCEALLFIRLFYNWGEFKVSVNSYYGLSIFLVAVWVLDNFILNSFLTINSLFRIIYSFTLIFLAINQGNRMLFNTRGALLKNPRFLISTGIVIFYSYKATFETFYLFKLNFSNNFYSSIHLILEAVNLLVNLIFALAVLWIPERQKFILRY